MARPKGTKKLSVEDIEKLYSDYYAHVKQNPRLKVEYVGRDGDKVKTPIERPVSMDGFFTFCYSKGVTMHHYFDNPEGAYDDYRGICTRIRQSVRSEQIDGGMCGFYNASITQRLNNLTDKQDVTVNTPPPLFPDVPTNDSDQ